MGGACIACTGGKVCPGCGRGCARRSTIRSKRFTNCGRERWPKCMLSIAENNPTPGSKHYHVLSSFSLSEPRMSSALSSASKIARYFPFVPTFVGKLSNWELSCILPGSQISNGNVIRTANKGSAGERGGN